MATPPKTMLSLRVTSLLASFVVGLAMFGCGESDSGTGSAAQALSTEATLQGPVIIGAGIAGARAAYELRRLGAYNVTVIAPTIAPGINIIDTGLTNTYELANGGTLDTGATLLPETYELLGVVRELGLELRDTTTNLAIVRNGRPVVIDQANPLSLYNLFSPLEFTAIQAAATQLEITRLKTGNFTHRDGRLYANETRTIDQYLTQFSGEFATRYLSIIPDILAGQDTATASAGFQSSLFTMTAPKVYTLPEMQLLPIRMLERSGTKIELGRVDKIETSSSTTSIEAVRPTGERVRFTTSAPVILATPPTVSTKLVGDASAEERALLQNPMRPSFGVTIELNPGWKRPAALVDTTYGGVPDVERGGGSLKGWALDFRSPKGDERVVSLTLSRPIDDTQTVLEAVREASRYLPGLEFFVKDVHIANNYTHAPALTPTFYKAVDVYWQWINQNTSRRLILAGSGANQYGMDGASFSGRLAAEALMRKMNGAF